MVNKTIYLAGPISGLTYQEATEWRENVKAQLEPYGIKCLSPLRAEVHLRNCPNALTDCQTPEEHLEAGSQVLAMSTPKGVITRDKFDCVNCGVLFLNLLGAKRVSIGSVVEVGWADSNNIPIVLIIDKEGNPHDHVFITETAHFITDNIDEGIAIVKAILGDY